WEAPLQASHRWDVSSGPGTLASSIVTPLSPVVSRASCSSATPGRARTQPRARGPACWGVRHRCRASCREGSCCPGSPSRRARMVTGTPLDRHEDKETSGALLDIDGARIASTRSAAGGQTYARPGPGGRAGPPPLVLGRAASSPSYKKGAALDRFGPVPTPTTRTVTNLLHDWVSNQRHLGPLLNRRTNRPRRSTEPCAPAPTDSPTANSPPSKSPTAPSSSPAQMAPCRYSPRRPCDEVLGQDDRGPDDRGGMFKGTRQDVSVWQVCQGTRLTVQQVHRRAGAGLDRRPDAGAPADTAPVADIPACAADPEA